MADGLLAAVANVRTVERPEPEVERMLRERDLAGLIEHTFKRPLEPWQRRMLEARCPDGGVCTQNCGDRPCEFDG